MHLLVRSAQPRALTAGGLLNRPGCSPSLPKPNPRLLAFWEGTNTSVVYQVAAAHAVAGGTLVGLAPRGHQHLVVLTAGLAGSR